VRKGVGGKTVKKKKIKQTGFGNGIKRDEGGKGKLNSLISLKLLRRRSKGGRRVLEKRKLAKKGGK